MGLDSEFEENWNSRTEIDPEIRGSIAKYWSSEKQFYYLIAPLDDLRNSLTDILESISEIDGLATYNPEFLHCTVKLFGENRPATGVIKESLSGFEPFELTTGRLNVFPEVLFLEVLNPEIRRINTALADQKAVERQPHDGKNYAPHISLGHYSSQLGYPNTKSHLEENRKIQKHSIKIEELHLVRDVPGKLPAYETVERFKL